MGAGEGAFDLLGNTATTLNPALFETLDDRGLAVDTDTRVTSPLGQSMHFEETSPIEMMILIHHLQRLTPATSARLV